MHQIESFSFMKRYRRDPHENIAGGKDRYGPGIFVFHLKEKQDRILHMPPFKHPSSLVRFLVSQGIPFANYSPCNRSEGTLPAETYQRPSLYMFWFFILFLTFLILGYYSISGDAWWGFIPAILSFGLSLFFICMLMTRFCYLTLDNDALTVHSVGRTIRYPYTDLRKVNFDFAREQTFTHIMELLDKDYRYRLFLYREGFEKEAERNCRTVTTSRSGCNMQPQRQQTLLSGQKRKWRAVNQGVTTNH